VETLLSSFVDVEGTKSRRNKTASATSDSLNLARILALKKYRKIEKLNQTAFDTGVSGEPDQDSSGQEKSL
jgi:hypothetical protein